MFAVHGTVRGWFNLHSGPIAGLRGQLPAVNDRVCLRLTIARVDLQAGSPYAKLCNSEWTLGESGCHTHVQAFAQMLPPLADFLQQHLYV